MSPEASRTCLIPELLVGQRLPEVGFVFEVTPSDAWELVWNHVFKWDFVAGKVETNCRRQAIDCIIPLAPGVNLCVTSVGTAHAGRLIVHFYTRSGEPSSYAKWRSEFDSPAPCMIGASAMPCDAPLLSRQTTVQLENGVQCSLLCLRPISTHVLGCMMTAAARMSSTQRLHKVTTVPELNIEASLYFELYLAERRPARASAATPGKWRTRCDLRVVVEGSNRVDMEGSILGLCNPLLDISASCEDEILAKYNLEANNAILAEEKHMPLYEELKAKADVEYIAGGAGQNSIRVAQWLLQVPGATTYVGAVGQDEFAQIMAEKAEKDGVNAQYYKSTAGLPTGTCAVVVTQQGQARSLVANLAAANTFSDDIISDAQWSSVERAKVVYITGFFHTVSPKTIMKVAEACKAQNKTLCMNLSAPFLLQVPPFFESFKAVLPYVDVYFGNETEAQVLAEAMGWETKDIKEIAVKLARTAGKLNARPRTVVFTQGPDPTVVAIGDEQRLWSCDSYGVIPCADEDLVDTNGAGDAFVGGMLAGMSRGDPIVQCVALGNYAANVVIKRSGCSYPARPSFKFKNVTTTY
ncbi:Adenosine kinase 2 [Porphyridium purpureum]|uniref:Adenosine kinase n=1 Tax=Porphyridium purpureum TaxID=35688 RepID=A0A5J4Z1X8_PORPP|nr:Adenosine kinase 2 [Porphyridium purpureum]|eukprot:POR8902..scf208_2